MNAVALNMNIFLRLIPQSDKHAMTACALEAWMVRINTNLGLYTILFSPIWYSVWHTHGRSEGGGVYCPTVAQ